MRAETLPFNTEKTEELLKKLVGEDWKDAVEKLGHHSDDLVSQEYNPVGVFVKNMDEDGLMAGEKNVSIGVKGHATIVFNIASYPYCCGLKMFYGFYVSDYSKLSADEIHQLLHTFFSENLSQNNHTYRPLGKNNRIELVMVEHRGIGEVGCGQGFTPDSVIPPVERPTMQYKVLWDFFHKYGKVTNDRLSYNANSYNILHNMEVILG